MCRSRVLLVRVLIAALALFTCSVSVASFLDFVAEGQNPILHKHTQDAVRYATRFMLMWSGISALTGIVAAGLALLLLWRAGDRVYARSLALMLGFLPLVSPALEEITARLGFNAALVVPWVALAAFLHFSNTFPQVLTEEDLLYASSPGRATASRRIALLPGRLAAIYRHLRISLQAKLLKPRTLGLTILTVIVLGMILAYATGPFVPESLSGLLDFVVYAFIFLYAIGIALGLSNLRTGYSVSGRPERRKVLWLLLGFIFAAWALLLGVATGVALLGLESSMGLPDWTRYIQTAGWLPTMFAPLVLVVCLAIGILHQGDLDPSLAIRRTVLLGSFSLVALFLFAGIENVIVEHLANSLGLPKAVELWIAGGAVAVTITLLHGSLKRLVGRFLPDVGLSAAASRESNSGT